MVPQRTTKSTPVAAYAAGIAIGLWLGFVMSPYLVGVYMLRKQAHAREKKTCVLCEGRRVLENESVCPACAGSGDAVR